MLARVDYFILSDKDLTLVGKGSDMQFPTTQPCLTMT